MSSNPTRARFATLDAMRGLAAVLVVFYHVGNAFQVPFPRSAYLAVDLFFALSGFVLAKRYDPQFEAGLTARGFMLERFVRLYPLYALGLLAGAAQYAVWTVQEHAGLANWLIATMANAAMLPAPVHGPVFRLFPGNYPAWSLFLEFWVANLMFALGWRYLTNRVLLALSIMSGLILLVMATRHHSVDLGSHWPDAAGGVVRVIFSFFNGVALWRWHTRLPMPAAPPSLALLAVVGAALAMPRLPHLAGIYDVACVSVLFPAAIFLGTNVRERRPHVGRAAGNLSYAIYILHAPLLAATRMVESQATGARAFVAIALFATLLLGAAWWAQYRFHGPAERWLWRMLARLRPADRPGGHAA